MIIYSEKKPLLLFICLFTCLFSCLFTYKLMANVLAVNPTGTSTNSAILNFAKSVHSEPRIQKLTSSNIITIIDFSVSSIHRRFWVLDIKNEEVLFHTLVSNGTSASHFSNKPHSHKSSIGVYLTGRTYYGKHGFSLKLHGIDGKFNNNAERRHLVVHKAKYATRKFMHLHHVLGRSWGCFAIEPKLSKDIIDKIKGGTILVAYYPSQKWFENSPFISPNTPRIE